MSQMWAGKASKESVSLAIISKSPDASIKMPLGYANVEASESEGRFHVHHGGGLGLLWLRLSPSIPKVRLGPVRG